MTHKEFVPYAEALALKELHFDEPCLGIHYNEGLNPSFMMATQYGEHGAAANGGILAPLYQQAFKFFREKYGLFYEIQIDRTTAPKFCFNIFQYKHFGNYEDIRIGEWYLYRTHEEAELECLKELIEIVKEK